MRNGFCAQTNVQLFNQLHQAGYGLAELMRVRRAYELAARLFARCLRASGKPFLAHAVGTASILASLHARPAVVIAGLLHAAYMHGERTGGKQGLTAQRRVLIRRVIGAEAETLVAQFTALPWNSRSLPLIEAGIAKLSPSYREIVLIRLANELEDHADLGVLYYRNVQRRLQDARRERARLVRMATRLGYLKLAKRLDEAFEHVLTAAPVTQLRTRRHHPFLLAALRRLTSRTR